MLHTISSLGACSGPHAFQDQQTVLDMVSPCCFQVMQTGKVIDLILSKTKGWEKEVRRKEKKLNIKTSFKFVGSVLRIKSFLLVPSGALYPTPSKQAHYAAGMIFTRPGILGRAAV